ncbi:N-acetylmuramoyl-L-alanine amidase [Bacillus sp. FDAARGOS_235]|uniref:N-acetylmuramoyl-L-alanine amidase n=1 Tax=Bacillus sp. FDAARGOS_235 TaxID=1839798 RepID=UPI002102A020|nr:N-acetylmuramoyl-L-alanine amidase [Bacillus sp. FDAARGOS_235]
MSKDVDGAVDAGLGFTIDAQVIVNGSEQYKVNNSRGNVFYITASSYYVKIK